VQSDGVPNDVDRGFIDAMLAQELARGVGAIDFKALGRAAIFIGQTHVMEHGSDVEQFRVELQILALSGQRAPVKNPGRVVEEKIRLRVSY
jgi:hypothetical protein